MTHLTELLERNRRWAEQHTAADPTFFSAHSGRHSPTIMWIGCADARVPAEQTVMGEPGELFVHRNVANLVEERDASCQTAIRYAVDALRVEHIIVCGHYECGGVHAAMGDAQPQPIEGWIQPIRRVASANQSVLEDLDSDAEKWARLCELNVLAQAESLARLPLLQEARSQGRPVGVHGWIYDLPQGRLKSLT